MSKNPGKLIQLPDGRKGIIYTKDQTVVGKIVITLINQDYKWILDDKGKPVRIIKSDFQGIKLIGYVD